MLICNYKKLYFSGFCNASYLSNTFRRAVGVSPKA